MKEYSFLTKRPFAHRGYHSNFLNYQIIPENSLDAFRQAIKKNYSIEMDIHFTEDFKIIVFHDFFLGRLTTKAGFVFSKSLDYIKEAKLSNDQTIPTLKEALNLINGRVPVLLEIKYSKHMKTNLEMFSIVLQETLENYKGPVALMSFSTDLIKFIRKKNFFTRFPIGLTTSFPKFESHGNMIKNNRIENEIVSNKFQFISQDWRGIENTRIMRLKKLGIAILSWTITSEEIEKRLKGLVDNITFEHYEPDLTK